MTNLLQFAIMNNRLIIGAKLHMNQWKKEVLSMGIFAWVVIGALAGWIASKFMNTDASMGAFANIVVGIVGALIGGFLMNVLGGVGITGFNLWSLLVAVIGSMILLWVLRLFKNR